MIVLIAFKDSKFMDGKLLVQTMEITSHKISMLKISFLYYVKVINTRDFTIEEFGIQICFLSV